MVPEYKLPRITRLDLLCVNNSSSPRDSSSQYLEVLMDVGTSNSNIDVDLSYGLQ